MFQESLICQIARVFRNVGVFGASVFLSSSAQKETKIVQDSLRIPQIANEFQNIGRFVAFATVHFPDSQQIGVFPEGGLDQNWEPLVHEGLLPEALERSVFCDGLLPETMEKTVC